MRAASAKSSHGATARMSAVSAARSSDHVSCIAWLPRSNATDSGIMFVYLCPEGEQPRCQEQSATRRPQFGATPVLTDQYCGRDWFTCPTEWTALNARPNPAQAALRRCGTRLYKLGNLGRKSGERLMGHVHGGRLVARALRA